MFRYWTFVLKLKFSKEEVREQFTRSKEMIEEIEKKKQELELANTKYDYLIDNSISDLDRFVRYVNESEGCEFITVQKLTELLNDKII